MAGKYLSSRIDPSRAYTASKNYMAGGTMDWGKNNCWSETNNLCIAPERSSKSGCSGKLCVLT